MSPFSHYLYELRMRHEIRQSELAELLGYEQSYISALEIGVKGPPTPEFIEKLIDALRMNELEQGELRRIAEASQRKLALTGDCPPDVYWMLKELREQVNELHPLQVKMIRDVLELRGSFAEPAPRQIRRIKRRRRAEVRM
ncbi:Transcriptional regulator [Cupriavidus taiwanensis]|uniref:Transcriptional regulator n=1 Tax=Cupriavidus taiwanensis TaxID=164546 RepID=A0A9Q7UQT2_9BURK|nr:helix-turn-helix transcriptional regulator [Cupriavidus taiwanensis]SPD62999.1 Transcriptional regulator [Cupriavidus taiwanensis]